MYWTMSQFVPTVIDDHDARNERESITTTKRMWSPHAKFTITIIVLIKAFYTLRHSFYHGSDRFGNTASSVFGTISRTFPRFMLRAERDRSRRDDRRDRNAYVIGSCLFLAISSSTMAETNEHLIVECIFAFTATFTRNLASVRYDPIL